MFFQCVSARALRPTRNDAQTIATGLAQSDMLIFPAIGH
jgi:hypothetical protein